ncbi:MAG TPA: hypothetical protein VGM49_05160 [Candidatus Limnocylindrales bacterium]
MPSENLVELVHGDAHSDVVWAEGAPPTANLVKLGHVDDQVVWWPAPRCGVAIDMAGEGAPERRRRSSRRRRGDRSRLVRDRRSAATIRRSKMWKSTQ